MSSSRLYSGAHVRAQKCIMCTLSKSAKKMQSSNSLMDLASMKLSVKCFKLRKAAWRISIFVLPSLVYSVAKKTKTANLNQEFWGRWWQKLEHQVLDWNFEEIRQEELSHRWGASASGSLPFVHPELLCRHAHLQDPTQCAGVRHLTLLVSRCEHSQCRKGLSTVASTQVLITLYQVAV